MTAAIADGHVVSIHLRLTLDDGTVVDDSIGEEPIEYVHGSSQMMPGLERALTGKQVGETCEVQLEPADAFGPANPMADWTVPLSQFPADAGLEPGLQFGMEGPDGVVPVWVRDVRGDEVVVTRDHPLAGQRLNYLIKVLDVRTAAEADEKAAKNPPDT